MCRRDAHRADEVDKVVGLELGADGRYDQASSACVEFRSRVKAALRPRRDEHRQQAIRADDRDGGVVIDLGRRVVTVDGR